MTECVEYVLSCVTTLLIFSVSRIFLVLYVSLRMQKQGWTRGELMRLLSNETPQQIELVGPPDHSGGAYERVGTVVSNDDDDEEVV